jgi:hypothetical protein
MTCGRVDPGEATPERRAGAAQRGLPVLVFSTANLPRGVPEVDELSRVVVLGSRPIEGDTINELIDNQTLLLKSYTWMARAVYK